MRWAVVVWPSEFGTGFQCVADLKGRAQLPSSPTTKPTCSTVAATPKSVVESDIGKLPPTQEYAVLPASPTTSPPGSPDVAPTPLRAGVQTHIFASNEMRRMMRMKRKCRGMQAETSKSCEEDKLRRVFSSVGSSLLLLLFSCDVSIRETARPGWSTMHVASANPPNQATHRHRGGSAVSRRVVMAKLPWYTTFEQRPGAGAEMLLEKPKLQRVTPPVVTPLKTKLLGLVRKCCVRTEMQKGGPPPSATPPRTCVCWCGNVAARVVSTNENWWHDNFPQNKKGGTTISDILFLFGRVTTIWPGFHKLCVAQVVSTNEKLVARQFPATKSGTTCSRYFVFVWARGRHLARFSQAICCPGRFHKQK